MSKRGGGKVGFRHRACPCCAYGTKKEDRKWFFNSLKQDFDKQIKEELEELAVEPLNNGNQ